MKPSTWQLAMLTAIGVMLVSCGSRSSPPLATSPAATRSPVRSPTQSDSRAQCTSDQVTAKLHTDRAENHMGTPVGFTIMLVNRSDKACLLPGTSCPGPFVTIMDSTSRAVWIPAAPGCPPLMHDGPTFGASQTETATWPWNQDVNAVDPCLSTPSGPCTKASAGTYQVSLVYEGFMARTDVTIVP